MSMLSIDIMVTGADEHEPWAVKIMLADKPVPNDHRFGEGYRRHCSLVRIRVVKSGVRGCWGAMLPDGGKEAIREQARSTQVTLCSCI